MRNNNIHKHILQKAKEFGACLAGIAKVEKLKKSPSHLIYGKLGEYNTVGNKTPEELKSGEIAWPENAKSAIIIAVVHPEEKSELDWRKAGYKEGGIRQPHPDISQYPARCVVGKRRKDKSEVAALSHRTQRVFSAKFV